jgi:hypothetical protein
MMTGSIIDDNRKKVLIETKNETVDYGPPMIGVNDRKSIDLFNGKMYAMNRAHQKAPVLSENIRNFTGNDHGVGMMILDIVETIKEENSSSRSLKVENNFMYRSDDLIIDKGLSQAFKF